jgi:hypothetical protein
VGQANILSTSQDLNALCTDPTTATSAHVKKACDLLTRHITKAFRQVSGLPLALQLAPLVGALKNDVVSKAALDMCLRLMPGAATQQIEEVWQVLPGLNFPPNESQLEQLLKLSAQGVGAWGPDGVGSCLGYLHRLYYLKRNPKMGEEQHKPLPMSLGTALQDLLHCFTQLADSKAAEQEQVISTVSCCGDLQAAPVSLLHLLDTKADALDYSRMGWDDVRVLLAAFGHFGCGMHDQEEQGGMPQPFHLIKRVCDRARQLFEAGGPLPSPHECRNICQSLAYLADGSNAPLLKDLAHRGRFGSSSSSMHQLWRAAQWLLQKLGQRLPASVDMTGSTLCALTPTKAPAPAAARNRCSMSWFSS